ncbi:hypothetical protein Ate01nite_36740 [Actinoplanes teichomyceticus]|nr:hypothetical protein Ate01nite_36740 [Actinoplanes teichomyceticus]
MRPPPSRPVPAGGSDSSPRPGPCRKPPARRYGEGGGGALRSPPRCRPGRPPAPSKSNAARDAAGKARRRVAAELIADLERIYQRSEQADKELKDLVAATGTTLMAFR